jgi:putative ABC transport system ATP-binding protein
MILQLENIRKSYGTGRHAVEVVTGVNLSVDQGEFLAVMGPSGSGKSTLMQILGFLDNITAGTYLFNGRDVSTLDDDELARMRGESVGFIFQAFNLLPKTSVLENVMLPLLYSNVPVSKREKMAMEAIDAVGLTHRAKNLSNQLSGGERQRVAIARALIRKPPVIFADEPTGNLDSKSGTLVMQILQKLNIEQGHTIILVTHETYTSEHAERILRIKDGLLVSDEKVKNRHMAGSVELLK